MEFRFPTVATPPVRQIKFPGTGGCCVLLSRRTIGIRYVSSSVIPVGLWLFLVVGSPGGGGCFFGSSVLRAAAANFLFLFPPAKGLADFLSMKSIRLVFWAMDDAAVPMFGVPWRKKRWTWIVVVAATANWRSEMKKMRLDLEDSIVIFFSFGVQFVIGEDVLLDA
jgi:hypothetical protein